jgi:hypothetical protein
LSDWRRPQRGPGGTSGQYADGGDRRRIAETR